MREAGAAGRPSGRWAIAGGVAAVVVLATGAAFGARMFLAGDDDPEPPATTAPASSPAAASAPATAASAVAPAAALPAAIPAKAFLRAADAPGKAKSAPERLGPGDQKLPGFCGAAYDRADRVGIRATQVLFIASAGAPPDATPKAAVYEDVIVFRADGATAFMEDLRTAVRDCPSHREGGVASRYYQRGTIGAGDESLLIEQTRPAFGEDGKPVGDGSLHHLYWAAVRAGDAVAFVTNAGWESGSADRDDTVLLGKRAAARLTAWRG